MTDSNSDSETDMETLQEDLKADGEYLTWLDKFWNKQQNKDISPEQAFKQWRLQFGQCYITGLPMLHPIPKQGKSMYTGVLIKNDTEKSLRDHDNYIWVVNFAAAIVHGVRNQCQEVKHVNTVLHLCTFMEMPEE